MNQVGTIIKMHTKDRWSWFFIPWIILISNFLINLIIGYFLRNIEESGVTTGGLASLFVYMLFAGMFALYATYAYATGFSVTRRDYFIGTMAMLGLVSLGSSIVLTVLAEIESFTGGWGVKLHFFDMPFMDQFSIIGEILLYFWVIVHLYLFGFLIACIHRRFGRNGLFVFFIALILISSVLSFFATVENWWVQLYEWIIAYSANEILYGVLFWSAGISVVYMLISYLLLRRSAAA